MSDDLQDHEDLLDDDPALDYLLYEEMEKESNQQVGKGGCLAGFVVLILPVSLLVLRIAV